MQTATVETNQDPRQSRASVEVQNLYCLGQVSDRCSEREVARAAHDTVDAFDQFRTLKREQIRLIQEEAALQARLIEINKQEAQKKKEREEVSPQKLMELPSDEIAQKLSDPKVLGQYLEEYVTESRVAKIVKSDYTLKEKIELRLQSIDVETGILERKLDTFHQDYLKGNALNLRALNENDVSLATTMAKGDLAVMLNSLGDLLDPTQLRDVLKLIKENQSPDISDSQKEINWQRIHLLAEEYLERHQQVLKEDTNVQEIKELLRNNNLKEVITKCDEYFKPFTQTRSYQEDIKEFEPFVESFARLPATSLEVVGITTSVPAHILEESSTKYALMDQREIRALDPRDVRRAIDARSRLWDTSLPWTQDINGQKDVELLTTSYAALKRISELTSAFESSLSEASRENLSSDQKIETRKQVITKFWTRFFETKGLIEHEMVEGLVSDLKNNSSNTMSSSEARAKLLLSLTHAHLNDPDNKDLKLVLDAVFKSNLKEEDELSKMAFEYSQKALMGRSENSRQNLLRELSNLGVSMEEAQKTSEDALNNSLPYRGLIKAFELTRQEDIMPSYSNEILNSHEKTFQTTIHNLNPAFIQVNNYLEATAAGPKDIIPLFRSVLNLNQNHPEYTKLHQWVRGFPERFSKILK